MEYGPREVICEMPPQVPRLPAEMVTDIRPPMTPVMRSEPVTVPSPALPIMMGANSNMFVPIPNQMHMFHQQHMPPQPDIKNLAEMLHYQFPGGLRPQLPGNPMMDPYHIQQMQYMAPRAAHLRPPRQLLKPPHMVPHTSCATVLPAPKMMCNNGNPGLIYENGHAANMPTKTTSQMSVPLDVPANTSTVLTMASSAITNVDSNGGPYKANHPGYMPCSVVPNLPVQGRTLTLGIPLPVSLSNTKVTYSIAPVTNMPPMGAVDSINNKSHLPPPPQLQPSPHMTGPPPPSLSVIHPPPNNSMDTGFHSIGSSQTNSTVTYSTPGFQTALSPATPAPTPINTQGPTQVPPSAGTPTPTHPPTPPAPPMAPPTQTPTGHGPVGSPGCSACGCNGHCNNAGPRSAPSFHYNYMWPQHPPGVFPAGFLPGLLPVSSNGLINPPNLPFAQHPLQGGPINLPNGLTPEVLYNNQHGVTLVQTGGHHGPPFVAPFPPGVVPGMPGIGNPGSHSAGSRDSSSASSTSSNGGGNGGKGKVITMCCNCGGTGHTAPECKEATMETMAQAGMS